MVAALLLAAAVFGIVGPATAVQGETIGFADVTEAVGLHYPLEAPDEDVHSEQVGGDSGYQEDGGIALIDIDGDGRLEIYVAHGGGETGRLFDWDGRRFARRAGNGGIAPATLDRAGYFIDLDDDGAPDFLSVQAEGTQAFRNDGAGRFKEAPDLIAGIRQDRHVYSMADADYDGDGDLDPFFAHWNRPWYRVSPTSPTHHVFRRIS